MPMMPVCLPGPESSSDMVDSTLTFPPIPPLDSAAMDAARARQPTLVKPVGALGRLEALSIQLAGMTGRADWLPRRRAVIVCAGDHGVMAHGVSTVPASVTAYMVRQFLGGGAAVNALARQMGAWVVVVDAGVDAMLPARATPLDLAERLEQRRTTPEFVGRKVARGTADFSAGPAMSAEQAAAALRLGLDVISDQMRTGLDIVAVGEMGIGNTTSASAIIAAITGRPVAEVTGRGTGIEDDALARKIAVIERALAVNAPADVDTLATVGGLEIGAMAGVMLGAAAGRVPVVIDGLISAAAALIARQIDPAVGDYLIAGHQSVEPGHIAALAHLGLSPLLNLEMRLGEGTGALLALPIIEAAMRTLNEMAILNVG